MRCSEYPPRLTPPSVYFTTACEGSSEVFQTFLKKWSRMQITLQVVLYHQEYVLSKTEPH